MIELICMVCVFGACFMAPWLITEALVGVTLLPLGLVSGWQYVAEARRTAACSRACPARPSSPGPTPGSRRASSSSIDPRQNARANRLMR